MCALHGLKLTKRKFYSLAGMPIRDIYLLLAKEQGALPVLLGGGATPSLPPVWTRQRAGRGLTPPSSHAGVAVDIEKVLADKRRIHETARARPPRTLRRP